MVTLLCNLYCPDLIPHLQGQASGFEIWGLK